MEFKRFRITPKQEQTFYERMNQAVREKRGPTRDEEHLSDRERNFVEHYFTTFSPVEACRAAGYGQQHAEKKDSYPLRNVANRVMKFPHVKRAIEKKRNQFKEKLQIEQEDVLYEYTAIAKSRLTDYLDVVNGTVRFKDFSQLTDAQKAAIEGISFITDFQTGEKVITKIKLHDKHKALDSLSKFFGLFEKDNRQKSLVNIQIDEIIAALPPEVSGMVRQRLADHTVVDVEGNSRVVN
jgi:phage terminase small subunit